MHPLYRTLWRNRFTAFLSILQMTLALAIVLNALSIFDARIERAFRPTGIDEAGILTLKQAWVTATDANGKLDTSPFIPRQYADIAALRHMPGVSNVSVVNSLPLAGWSRVGKVSLKPLDKAPRSEAALYYADDSLQSTLRFTIGQGRNFLSTEIRDVDRADGVPAGPILVTKPLATSLFGTGSALGKAVYMNGSGEPSTIVGIVDTLQTPTRSAWGDYFAYSSVIVPARIASDTTYFAIRAKPGELASVKSRIADVLYKVSPNRVIEDADIKSFADLREESYRADVAMAWMMVVICAIFLVITCSCIVGLTSFWVRKRQRSIGVRRALGATKRDILLQFLTENAVMSTAAALLGAVVAVALNRALMAYFEANQLPLAPVLIGMLVLLSISLASALVPSMRAATVAPVVAMRNS